MIPIKNFKFGKTLKSAAAPMTPSKIKVRSQAKQTKETIR